jgi:uncharacterized protein YecT (DUF1311 family)
MAKIRAGRFFSAMSAELSACAAITRAVSGVAGASAAPAGAQHRPLTQRQDYSQENDICLTRARGDSQKMLNCNGAEIERQDLLLNEAYRTVMARLNPQQRIVLRDYERRWLALRDRQCAQESSARPGQIDEIAYSRCILTKVTSRREWVENYRP